MSISFRCFSFEQRSTLRKERGLARLVLRDFVRCVLAALLALAVGVSRLWHVHLSARSVDRVLRHARDDSSLLFLLSHLKPSADWVATNSIFLVMYQRVVLIAHRRGNIIGSLTTRRLWQKKRRKKSTERASSKRVKAYHLVQGSLKELGVRESL